MQLRPQSDSYEIPLLLIASVAILVMLLVLLVFSQKDAQVVIYTPHSQQSPPTDTIHIRIQFTPQGSRFRGPSAPTFELGPPALAPTEVKKEV